MSSATAIRTSTNTIREVFGYINRFKGQVFVLKIADELLEAPLFPLLIKDIVLIKNMGIKIILVPGAKNSIDQVLQAYGEKTETRDHIRITTDQSLPLVKLGASNVSNRLLTLLSNMFTDLNLTDMETCYKAFTRQVLDRVNLVSDRFGIEPEITAKVARLRVRIYEVPISYHGRTYGEGKKIGWRDGVKAFFSIVYFRFFD